MVSGCVGAVGRGLDGATFVGAASCFAWAWNLLLGARELGWGGVLTTMATRNEDEASALLGVPDGHALAALVVLGLHLLMPQTAAVEAAHVIAMQHQVLLGGHLLMLAALVLHSL